MRTVCARTPNTRAINSGFRTSAGAPSPAIRPSSSTITRSRELQRQIQIVRHRHHQQRLRQIDQQSIQRQLMTQIQVRRRLVQQQRFGPLRQRRRQDHSLRFSSGQRPKIATAKRQRVGSRHGFFRSRPVFVRLEPAARVGSAPHQDHFLGRKRKLQLDALREKRHAFARTRAWATAGLLLPANTHDPRYGDRSPARIPSSVDFPAPFGPAIVISPCFGNSKLASCRPYANPSCLAMKLVISSRASGCNISKKAFAASTTRGPGSHVDIRRHGVHSMLFHRRHRAQPVPQAGDFALVLIGHADRIRHIAHVDDHVRIPRQHFFERHSGYEPPHRETHFRRPPAR